MAKVKLIVTGITALDKALRELAGPETTAASRKALRHAATIVLNEAKNSVPVLQGYFRRSLTVRAYKRTRKGRMGYAVTQRDVPPRPTTSDKSKGYYGSFLELGYRPTGRPLKTSLDERGMLSQSSQDRVRMKYGHAMQDGEDHLIDKSVRTYRNKRFTVGQLRQAQHRRRAGAWYMRHAGNRKEEEASTYWRDQLWVYVSGRLQK